MKKTLLFSLILVSGVCYSAPPTPFYYPMYPYYSTATPGPGRTGVTNSGQFSVIHVQTPIDNSYIEPYDTHTPIPTPTHTQTYTITPTTTITTTDNAVARFDGPQGNVQNSNWDLDDNGFLQAPGSIRVHQAATPISGSSLLWEVYGYEGGGIQNIRDDAGDIAWEVNGYGDMILRKYFYPQTGKGVTSSIGLDATRWMEGYYDDMWVTNDLTFTSGTAKNVPTPTDATDAANKQYVDAVQTAIPWDTHTPVPAATPYGNLWVGGESAVTPSAIVRQVTNPSAYTWAQIAGYASGGVTCTVFMDPGGSGVSVVSGKVHAVTCTGSAGLTFIQATDANRPITATGPGGYLCLRNGVGVTQFMSSGPVSGNLVLSAEDTTIFMVYKRDGSAATRFFSMENTDTSNCLYPMNSPAGGVGVTFVYGVFATGSVPYISTASTYNSRYHITSFTRNAADLMGVYVDGSYGVTATVSDTNGITGLTVPVTFRIFSNKAEATFTQGDVSAIIILNGYISETSEEYKKIYNGIAAHFNLPAYPSSTNVIQEWWNTIGKTVAKVTDTGKLWLTGGADIVGSVVVTAINDADNILTVIGTSLHTGDLMRLQGNGGGVTVTNNGGVTGTTAGFSGALNSASVSSGMVTVATGLYVNSNTASVSIVNTLNANDGITTPTNYSIRSANLNNTNGVGTGICFVNSTAAGVGAAIINTRIGSLGYGDLSFYTLKSDMTFNEVLRLYSGGGVLIPGAVTLSAGVTGTTAGFSGNVSIGASGLIVPLCTPTLIIPAAGTTMVFKCGVCTGVNP